MKNSEKAELRRDIRELVSKGYSQKEAIKTLVEYGYSQSTARNYWKTFSQKYINELKTGFEVMEDEQ